MCSTYLHRSLKLLVLICWSSLLLSTNAVAMGGFEGSFEYSIDAPWRLEPHIDGNTQSPSYGAIPIQITIHDALDAGLDDAWRGIDAVGRATQLGKVCSLKITEPGATTVYDFDEFAEVETTGAHWTWPSNGPTPPHAICRAWTGENCAGHQDVSQTSEWHALVWHNAKTTVAAGDYLSLTAELKLTRTPETSCNADVTFETILVPLPNGQKVFSVPSVLTFRNHLRVRFGDAPLPRFDDNNNQWLYGDLHYHSQGTDNEGETAYNYRGVVRAMGALGIDFLFATEHASHSEQAIDADFEIDLDLPTFDDHNPFDIDENGTGGVLRDMSRRRFDHLHGILHAADGVNEEAAPNGNDGPPQTVVTRGVLPQIYLGGEVDVVPDACNLEYMSHDEIQAALDEADGPIEALSIIREAAFPKLPYGNGLKYRIRNLCSGFTSQITTENCGPDDILVTLGDGTTLFRDVQAVNSYDFGREHMLYFPNTPSLTISGDPPFEAMCRLCEFCPGTGEDTCNCQRMTCEACDAVENPQVNICNPLASSPTSNSAFVASNTGPFGGAKRRLNHWVGLNPPMLPELEWKGYSFVAHHLNAPAGGQGPNGPPWSRNMLRAAWESPAVLGLQFWNENVRGLTSIDSQANDASGVGFHGEEVGYDRNDGIGGPKPVDDARGGFLSDSGLFEFIPYDLSKRQWGQGSSHVDHQLHHGAADWDRFNLRGLNTEKTSALDWLEPGEPRRLFFAGGSDAHGDFNYRRAGYFMGATEANDTTIASPRNLLRVKREERVDHSVEPGSAYPYESVMGGLRRGEFAVTDGPALRIVVDRNRNGVIDDADTPMGGILNLYGETSLPLLVEWKSTEEFGPVAMVDLYVGSQNEAGVNSAEGERGRTYSPYRHGTRGPFDADGLPSSSPHGYTDGSSGRTYRLLDDGYWHVTRTPTTSLRVSGSPDSETGSANPAPDVALQGDEAMTGVRSVNLDLQAFESARNTQGTRFFIRAFAKTQYKEDCRLKDINNACIRRYAYTNPIWAIQVSSSSACEADPLAFDQDGDGLPDHCDTDTGPPTTPTLACVSPPDPFAAEVEVDMNKLVACGSFAGARESADKRQYIFCRTQVLKPDASPYSVCQARNAQGDTLTCLGTGKHVETVLNLPDDAHLHFTAREDAKGVKRCSTLVVTLAQKGSDQ